MKTTVTWMVVMWMVVMWMVVIEGQGGERLIFCFSSAETWTTRVIHPGKVGEGEGDGLV